MITKHKHQICYWTLVMLSVFIVVRAQDAKVPTPSQRVMIATKLNSLIIPKADFQNVGIDEFLQFLSAQSKELDPDKKGIDFILVLSIAKSPLRITGMSLSNMSISQLLTIGMGQNNLEYGIHPDGVYIYPQDTTGSTIAKLNTISIDVDKVDVDMALQKLSEISQKTDPDGVGIACVMANHPDPLHSKVTLHLKNVPLKAILDSISQQTGVTYTINGRTVACTSSTQK